MLLPTKHIEVLVERCMARLTVTVEGVVVALPPPYHQ